MTAEVRTTVDEKILNQMVQPEKVEDPVIDEVKSEEPKIAEDKVSDNTPYDISPVETKGEEKPIESKDEYGNEVTPKKTYTEDEVNELMRQRFNRTKKEETAKQIPEPHEASAEETQNWESQLEGFVENTVKKLSQKEQQKTQEIREKSMQAEFEDKMMRGMGKYKDFQDVVSKMPISDTMLLATRQMKDPAAFIYAASKTQAKEIERISQIQDPYHQAAEMGRLEERMKKLRAGTGSPRPVSEIKGDIENKSYVRPSIDDLIRKDGLKKFSRRY